MIRYIYVFFTFIGIFVGGEAFLQNYKYTEKQKELSTLNVISSSITQNIQQKIAIGISSTKMLESMLKVNNFDTKNFDHWAKEISKLSVSIRSIQLAPNAIQKYVYPYEEHKEIIGHNLLSDEARRNGALEAIKVKDIFFVGPLKLIQNNKLSVIARKPVFKDGKFWGFAISLMYIEDLVKGVFNSLEDNGFKYKLTTKNLDIPNLNIIAQSKQKWEDNDSVIKYSITVPNGVWHLHINYKKESFINSIWIHIFLFFFALVFSYYVFLFENKSFKQAKELKRLNTLLEKQAHTDLLTSLPNRRSALESMNRLLALSKRYKEEFSLCYLDLDYFKELNDLYGHELGDKALIHFSKIISKNLRKSDIFSRWGGDEFLLALPKTDENTAKEIVENLRKKIQNSPLKSNSQEFILSTSIGVSSLKNDKESLDSIITKADKALYTAKEKSRNTTEIYSE